MPDRPRRPISACERLTLADAAGSGFVKKAMSVQIDVHYQGGLRCKALHAPSQAQFSTDAPVDNHGRGESFSPTDLLATALGSCILTTMGIYAERNAIDLRGARVTVLKEMTQVPTRRLARLTTEIRMPLSAAHPQREALERAAQSCPVHASLHPEIEMPIRFIWEGEG
jgi:putative redox protein